MLARIPQSFASWTISFVSLLSETRRDLLRPPFGSFGRRLPRNRTGVTHSFLLLYHSLRPSRKHRRHSTKTSQSNNLGLCACQRRKMNDQNAALCFTSGLPVQRYRTFLTGTGETSRCRHSFASVPQHSDSSAPLMMNKKQIKRPPKGFNIRQMPRFKFTGKLRPGVISPLRQVPDDVPRPDYWKTGKPGAKLPRFAWEIAALSPEEIEKMRVSCRLAREVLDIAGRMVKPGVLTEEIDAVVHAETIERGAYPSPLNYNKFPKSCCTSINEVICHGIPDTTALVDGDIINIDVTVYYNGFHGDCSETFLVGNVDEKGRKLARVTHECLEKAIEECKPGLPVKKIGGFIEDHAKKNGFSVVRNFCGHGVNSVFHTTPNVMHFRNDEPAGVLKPGVTFTIEPMINEGTHKNVIWPDDWTATTSDGRRSAQFEHTLLVVEDGVERLTGKIETSPKYFWEE